MGKNQQYKAMQRAKLGSASGGPEEVEDGMMDGSFHSPEWHAARLASLNTSHTVTWEEFKRKQKEDELKKGELEADKDRMMKEYRAQLDAERARKLALGRNHSSSKLHRKKERTPVRNAPRSCGLSKCIHKNTEKKDKDSKKRSSRKRKHRRRSSDSSTSSSSSESSSSEDERESKRSRSRKSKKERRHRSRAKHSSSDSERDGPLPLSRFFGTVKS